MSEKPQRKSIFRWENVLKIGVIAGVAWFTAVSLKTCQYASSAPLVGSDPTMGYASSSVSPVESDTASSSADTTVLVKDLSAAVILKDEFLGLPAFEKQQAIEIHGTAVYTVDLSTLSDEQVYYNATSNTLSVKIPHPVLNRVTVDPDSLQISEMSRQVLGWGGIRLNAAASQAVEKQLQAALEKEASSAAIQKEADEAARRTVRELSRSFLLKQDPTTAIIITFTAQ